MDSSVITSHSLFEIVITLLISSCSDLYEVKWFNSVGCHVWCDDGKRLMYSSIYCRTFKGSYHENWFWRRVWWARCIQSFLYNSSRAWILWNCLMFSSFLVCFQSFQKSIGKDEAMPDSLRNLIFANFEPVYKFHETFLKDVEQRLAQWCVYQINVFIILQCVQTAPTITDTRLDLSFRILICRLMPVHLLVKKQ